MFLNMGFCADPKNSLIRVANDIGTVKNVKVQNCIIKELFMTKTVPLSITNPIQQEWDFDTIIHVIYKDNNINGGNVDFGVNNTTDLLIKRREKGTFKWITIYHKKVMNKDDFIIVAYDRYVQSGVTYEYALVPVNGNVESSYNINEVSCEFEGMYLLEKDVGFECLLDIKGDFQRNIPSAVIKPLYSTAPRIIDLSRQNYESGNFSVTAIQRKECDYDMQNAWKYREEFMTFLCDRKPKILKTFDGKLKLIRIVDTPSQTQESYWNAPKTSYSYIEVGNIANKDLYNFDLLDISDEWWVI